MSEVPLPDLTAKKNMSWQVQKLAPLETSCWSVLALARTDQMCLGTISQESTCQDMFVLGGQVLIGQSLRESARGSAPLGLVLGLVLPHDSILDIPHLERKHTFIWTR